MATFPAALPKIPYGGFSPVRLQAPGTVQFGPEPSRSDRQVKAGPDIPCRTNQFAQTFEITSARKVLPPQSVEPRRAVTPPGPRGPRSGWVIVSQPSTLTASSASLVPSDPLPSEAGYKAGLWHSRTLLPGFQTFRAFTARLFRIAAINFRRESGACISPCLPHRHWPLTRGKKVLALQHSA